MSFVGMMGTGKFTADERPKNWREKILHLYPNGSAPLTAIMSKMKSESTDDAEFKWFEKTLASQAGEVTGVYTNEAMTTAYTTGGLVGDTLYVKVPLAFVQQVRIGHQLLLRDKDDFAKDINAKVTARLENGANSRITVTLLEADGGPTYLASSDRALIIGNINPEGGLMPAAVTYGQETRYNYTQIARTPLSITRTARKTKLRTGDKYAQMKAEALELHSIELEKNAIYSIPTETVSPINGQIERTSGGLMYFIRQRGIMDHYVTTDVVADGTTWLNGGEDWLDEMCRRIFKYGPRERIGFCGDKTILAIQKLIKNNSRVSYELKATTKEYGLNVVSWMTPFGTIHLMLHPLFSYENSDQSSMLVLAPQYMIWRYIDDTTFFKDGDKQNTGHTRKDATDEEFLTEGGYEIHHAECFAYLSGFGVDHAS